MAPDHSLTPTRESEISHVGMAKPVEANRRWRSSHRPPAVAEAISCAVPPEWRSMEVRVKSASWPAGQTVTPSNPLQDSFIKLEEAEQLRQQRKFDRAEAICTSLVRRYPDYMGALHTLGLIYADKNNYQRAFDCLARAAMIWPCTRCLSSTRRSRSRPTPRPWRSKRWNGGPVKA